MEKEKLSQSFIENREYFSSLFRVSENFDVIEKPLLVGGVTCAFFYIDGLVKDSEMQKIMQYILSEKTLPSAEEFFTKLPYIEAELTDSKEKIERAVLSGQSAFLAESFSDRDSGKLQNVLGISGHLI